MSNFNASENILSWNTEEVMFIPQYFNTNFINEICSQNICGIYLLHYFSNFLEQYVEIISKYSVDI